LQTSLRASKSIKGEFTMLDTNKKYTVTIESEGGTLIFHTDDIVIKLKQGVDSVEQVNFNKIEEIVINKVA
jgi:hypothetical protein